MWRRPESLHGAAVHRLLFLAIGAASLPLVACLGEDSGTPATASKVDEDSQRAESAAAVYAAVSPAIPLVQSPAGSGAGLLTEGGYVLTAATLVTRGGPVSVTFGEGQQAVTAPVAAVDPVAGTALLGPVKATVSAARIAETASVPPGSDLLTIGYAAGQPSPAIARSMLSNTMRWEPVALSLLQLDAPGARNDGPSFAVTTTGHVLGITAWGAGAPAPAVAEALARLRSLLDPKAGARSGARLLAAAERRPVQKLEFDGLVTERWLGFDARAGAPVTLILSGSGSASLTVRDATGAIVQEGATAPDGKLRLTFVPKTSGLLAAVVRLGDRGKASFELSSDADLALFTDPDDLRTVKAGEGFTGSFDFPGDVDVLFMDLVEGQVATVLATSGRADPLLEVFSETGTFAAVDDDSGKGAFGTDALIKFKAPVTGRYVIRISDSELLAEGGYLVDVTGAASDAEIDATIAQVRGLIDSISADPRAAKALKELVAGIAGQGAPGFPAAYGAAWRGSVKGGVFVTEVTTTDTEAGEGPTRTVSDPDGRFRVNLTLLASGMGSATLVIRNAAGEPITEGTGVPVGAACATGMRCRAFLALDIVEAAGSGPWTITLENAEGELDGWQIGVVRSAEDWAKPTLPAQ